MTQQDDRPLMNLGHLVIPHESASQDWLRRQGEKRQEAVGIVTLEMKNWMGDSLPEEFYTHFAKRVVAALDQRL